jgi:TatD DNase family protein
MLTDTHAHICDPIFDPDREKVLQRARSAGLGAIIAVSETLSDAKKNLELASRHPMIRPSAGLYPAVLERDRAEEMYEFIREHRQELSAIGEVGLDFWIVKEQTEKEIQKEIFGGFIKLSIDLGLPLNIHSRSAGRHVIALLLENGAERVQLHAFDGKATNARPGVEAGYFFSIPPSIVRSRQKQKLVKQLPLASLLIESDSPVLGPRTNERNEPANITVSIGAIAAIKGITREEVAAAVGQNTHRLYGKI